MTVERVGEWRMIESEEPDEAAPTKAAVAEKPPVSARLVIAAVVTAVLVVAGVAIWATLPQGGVKFDLASGPGLVPVPTSDFSFAAPTVSAGLVVDVEGAVVDPGVHQVLAGSRVADAIAAAGGYSTEVDIAAAAGALNLAEPLTDGQKVHVPARGEVAVLPDNVTPAPGGTTTGPVDINHASADELDTLPGIGPVTAAKIIAARPFATIDELDTRDVVGPSTLDKIRDLIILTP
ncbi:MAG: ComEA family DNA-binding protein [Candidatus Limnocylindrales bacterium]